MVEIVVKKTTELSADEKTGLLTLFNEIFSRSRTIDEFNNQYCQNALGHSYHVIMVDDGKIVGSISRIPGYYRINGVRFIFTTGVDAMILKKYRDFFYYYDMVTAINDFSRKEGAVLDYCFPNDISNPVVLKGKIAQPIGRLETYVIPYRIGGVNGKLRFLNPVSVSFSRIWTCLMAGISSKRQASFLIEKDAATYNATRYQRMNADYSVVSGENIWFVYKIMNYQGIRTAFLIDVAAKSARNFNKAVRYIIQKRHKDFDVILYSGVLPFNRTGLIKVPRKYEPKNFNFAAVIFDDSQFSRSEVFKIRNWDINLSNTDLI